MIDMRASVTTLAATLVAIHRPNEVVGAFRAQSTPSLLPPSSAAPLSCRRKRQCYSLALQMAREGTDAPQRRRQQQAKRRRFLQAAHPVAAPIKQREAGQATGSQRAVEDEQSQSAAGGRSSSLDQTSGRPRRSPPLQTGKSIDELESILEKRWGTAQITGSSGEGDNEDADFVMSFDKGSDDFRKSELKGAAVFSRPIDPWAAEDERKQSMRQRTSSNEDEAAPKMKKKQQRYDKQDAMLNRVRSNQAKLGKQPMKGGSDFINVPIKSRDYYDEDDFGFESRGSLISPKPVGGRGSSKSEGGQKASKKSSLGGGIFSERSVGDSSAERDGSNSDDGREVKSQREETKKRPKRVEAPSTPLLDSEGNEMFLTLDQADKFVRDILEQSEQSTATVESPSDGDFVVTEWRDIGITDPTLLENLQGDMGCQCPLPVQDKACPPIVAGNDCLVSTHTGSGKS